MNNSYYTVIVPVTVSCVVTFVTAHSAVAGTICGCEASNYSGGVAKVITVAEKGIENSYKHSQTPAAV